MTVVEGARRARVDDVGTLAELATMAIDELAAGRGGVVWRRTTARRPPLSASLAAAIDAPDQLVVAGTIDDVVVGYAVAHTAVLDDGGRLGVLDDLYTQPEARAVGVGEAMMDAVLAWAVDEGCFGLDSLALPGDRATKNFFERYGLVARAIVVHRPLDPSTDESDAT